MLLETLVSEPEGPLTPEELAMLVEDDELLIRVLLLRLLLDGRPDELVPPRWVEALTEDVAVKEIFCFGSPRQAQTEVIMGAKFPLHLVEKPGGAVDCVARPEQMLDAVMG